MENYQAALLLSAAGDAIGYKNWEWKSEQSGAKIMEELDELGGLGSLTLHSDAWPVSDETIMHMATARALIARGRSKKKDELYNRMAAEYKKVIETIARLRPDPAFIEGSLFLRPGNVFGWHTPFNKHGTGFGATTNALCVGLVFWRPEQLDHLVAVATECGRMTHNHPLGFSGAVCSALFTSYILQSKPITAWGRSMLTVFCKVKEYCKKMIRHNEEYKPYWSYFETKWELYLRDRKISQDGEDTPIFPNIYDVATRDKVYRAWSSEGQPGRRGHDAPMIAYDALLATNQIQGNKWQELCFHAMVHGGENDATGFIAGFWYGLMNGLTGVPNGHHEHLQYREELNKLARQLHEMTNQD